MLRDNDNKTQVPENTYLISIPDVPTKVTLTDIRNKKTGSILSDADTLQIQKLFEKIPPGRYPKKEIRKKIKNFPYGIIKQLGNDGKIHLYAIYKGVKHGLHLGEGGFGKTKLAQNIETGEWIVLKVTKSSKEIEKKISDATIRSIVSSEHKILSSFNRSKGNVISHLSNNKTQKYNITMEFVNGNELYKYLLNKQNLTMLEVLDVANGMVDAIRKINQKNYLHRDIHPGNFIYNSLTREVVAIDLGFAVQKNKDNVFVDTQIIGQKEYIAPEIFNDKYPTYSEKTEVYALGVSLGQVFGVTSTIDFKVKSPCSDNKEIIGFIKSMTNIDPEKRPTLQQVKDFLEEKRNQLVPLKLRTVGIINIADLLSGKKQSSFNQALREVNEVILISEKEVEPFDAMKVKRELEKQGIIVRTEIIVTNNIEHVPPIVEKLHKEQFKGMTVMPQFYLYHSSKEAIPEYKKVHPIKVITYYKDYHPEVMKGLSITETDFNKAIAVIEAESIRLKNKIEEKSGNIFFKKDVAENRVKLLNNFISQLNSNPQLTYYKLSNLLVKLESEMANTTKVLPKFLLGESDGRKVINKLKEEIKEDFSKKKKL